MSVTRTLTNPTPSVEFGLLPHPASILGREKIPEVDGEKRNRDLSQRKLRIREDGYKSKYNNGVVGAERDESRLSVCLGMQPREG